MTAIRNASVLPVPVWAWPATSRPAQGERQGQRLDGGAAGESGGFEPGEQRRMEVEFGEGDIGKGLVAHAWGTVSGAVGALAPGGVREADCRPIRFGVRGGA